MLSILVNQTIVAHVTTNGTHGRPDVNGDHNQILNCNFKTSKLMALIIFLVCLPSFLIVLDMVLMLKTTGGVTAMDDFLMKFFPAVYERKKQAHEDNYCKYDNQFLQLFTSSLYLAALVASFFASATCSKLGRKPTMQLASIFFLIGVGLASGAANMYMLIMGRILLGFGVGFGNQVL